MTMIKLSYKKNENILVNGRFFIHFLFNKSLGANTDYGFAGLINIRLGIFSD